MIFMNPNLVLERQEVVLLKHSWVPYMAWLHICMTATLTLHFLLFLVSSFWRKTNFGCTNKIFKLMHHTAAKLDFQFKIQLFVCTFSNNYWGRGISPYGQISLQSGATSPTISNQVAISPTKHRLRLQYLLPFPFLQGWTEPQWV